MYGFVSSAIGVTARPQFGLPLRQSNASARPSTARVTMQSGRMSKSVPFLLKPKNLDGLPGSVDFDPLLISDYVNVRFLQEAEIKHGRVCMLACLGMLVQEQITFGGSYFPKMLPVDAHNHYIATGGMGQILMFIAAFEAVSYYALKQTMEGKSAPGDFGFDPLGFGKDPTAFKKYQLNEIKNGRLAMIGIGGFIHQQWVTQEGTLSQLLHFKHL